MSAALDMERVEWLEQRRRWIGGSDAATLFDANPHSSRLALYYDKIGEGPPDEPSAPATWGTLLEPAVKAAYEQQTGRKLGRGLELVTHPRYPWMGANTDATIEPVPEYSGPGVYEGKVSFTSGKVVETVGGIVVATWAADEGAPLGVQIQGQHYLAVSGWQWVGFACFRPGDVLWGKKDPLVRVDMPRNERFIEVLCEKAYEFWHEHVLPRVPPPADGSEATLKALRYAFPQSTERVYVMPPEVVEVADQYKQAKAEEAAAAKRAKALGNELRQAMGDASYAYGHLGMVKVALSYKAQRKPVPTSTVLEIVEGMMGAEFRTHVEIAMDERREPNRVFKVANVKTVEKVLAAQGPAEPKADDAGRCPWAEDHRESGHDRSEPDDYMGDFKDDGSTFGD